MRIRPKIGILFLTSGWFRDVGLQVATSPLTRQVEGVAAEVVEKLSSYIDIVYSGVVYSISSACKAGELFRYSNVDGVLLSPLVWCEDQILIAALKELTKIPVILCTLFPYSTLNNKISFQEMLKGSSSVASLQMSGFLQREGYQYVSIFGYYKSDDLYAEILDHCKAFAIKRRLKHTKCGVLPFRCDQMTVTYVDEFVLRRIYGVELTYLELARMREEACGITQDEIQRFKKLLQDEEYEIGVDEKNLTEGIRYAIAMEKIITEYGLSMLAMNDVTVEMHQAFGLRPCLTNPRLTRAGIVVAMEADVSACVAMHILLLFTGESPFYTEIFTADLKKNALLMGHAGYHDPTSRDKAYPLQIIHDVEYENSDHFKGACTYFKYKPGPVTVVNSIYNGKKFQWTVFEGMSLEGPPVLEGNCHLFCNVDIQLKRFYGQVIERGVSQHWIVIPGIHKEGIKKLCRWLNIDFTLIT